jgi:phospholipase/carboxylesterase
MFPIETAYMAQAELEAAGANLTFRPIEELSHTYARTENPAVLDWFLG